jgi:RimJ/RimL family protein N-acetyltransferase
MFPLNPDLARLLFGFTIDDELRRADHRRRLAQAREVRQAGRGLAALPAAGPAAGTRSIAPDIRIAEAGPAHRRALLAFLRELSPQTAYNRFVTQAPPADVVDAHLMLANDDCHRAVLALRGDEIVGHAHAVASPDGRTAELGVVVADEWQGRGIGPRLVRALLQAGPPATAGELELLVLAWNTRARRMIKGLWPDAVAEREGELIHYRVRTARTLGPATLVDVPATIPCRT